MPTLTDFLCYSCMTWHEPPACKHNSEKPCAECGKPVGYRFLLSDRTLAPADRCADCQRVWEIPHAAQEPIPHMTKESIVVPTPIHATSASRAGEL